MPGYRRNLETRLQDLPVTPRERVLKTFRFQETDRVAFDLMEGSVWPELLEYFRANHGLEDAGRVLSFLDTDFRWVGMLNKGPDQSYGAWRERPDIYTKYVGQGRLTKARTVADIESSDWPDPAWWQPGDFQEARRQWPDHALVFFPGWKPLFWSACEAFGMEDALVKMITAPQLFDAFVRRQHEFYMDILSRGLQGARGLCDICWLGDDYAHQKAMLMNPDLWRRHIRPLLAQQVRLAREHEMYVLFHSCGAVRPILNDLMDIGVNALCVFQTTAAGMDAQSIAAEFGGRLAFYGGIDVQRLLSYGTAEEVQAEVRANVQAFSGPGGYIVANSHHGVATIRGQNIVAMCKAAKKCTFPLAA